VFAPLTPVGIGLASRALARSFVSTVQTLIVARPIEFECKPATVASIGDRQEHDRVEDGWP
jgi:hypothetical protein